MPTPPAILNALPTVDKVEIPYAFDINPLPVTPPMLIPMPTIPEGWYTTLIGSNAEVVGLGDVPGVRGGEGDGPPSSEREMSISSVSNGVAGNSYAVEDEVVEEDEEVLVALVRVEVALEVR